jgi:hypothetical protein
MCLAMVMIIERIYPLRPTTYHHRLEATASLRATK